MRRNRQGKKDQSDSKEKEGKHIQKQIGHMMYLADLERDGLSLLERAESRVRHCLDGTVVHEAIVLALHLDEAKSLLTIEPLNCTSDLMGEMVSKCACEIR